MIFSAEGSFFGSAGFFCAEIDAVASVQRTNTKSMRTQIVDRRITCAWRVCAGGLLVVIRLFLARAFTTCLLSRLLTARFLRSFRCRFLGWLLSNFFSSLLSCFLS